MNIDEIKLYLPKYLSSESEKELFKGLREFPDKLELRLYTDKLTSSNVIYQGDGLNDMLIVNLPSQKIKPEKAVIISNTCDIDEESNKRHFPSSIIYTPIFNLNKYKEGILRKSNKSPKQIDDHINTIKKQEITQIFYLPKYKELDDSIIFLDRLQNCSNSFIKRDNLDTQRLFTLSDLGAYLFVLKLSIHFTRIKDKVDRGFLAS